MDAGSKKLVEGPRIGGKDFLTDHMGTLIRLELRSQSEGHARHARVYNQTTLDKLYYCKDPKITERQWQAGRNWQGLYQRGGYSQLKAMDLNRVRGKPSEGSDAMMQARHDYEAKAAQLGKIGESVLYWVVICSYSPREYGDAMGLYRTDGIGVLRLALTALADLYGLPE